MRSFEYLFRKYAQSGREDKIQLGLTKIMSTQQEEILGSEHLDQNRLNLCKLVGRAMIFISNPKMKSGVGE